MKMKSMKNEELYCWKVTLLFMFKVDGKLEISKLDTLKC